MLFDAGFDRIDFFARADGQGDNHPENVRRIPKLGIEVSAKNRKELRAGLEELNQQIEALGRKKNPRVQSLLPDVIIFARAVDEALAYQEFFREVEIQVAKQHLERGLERAKQLAGGKAPWTSQTGLVVRGYVSKLDGSVQPYGLVIPANYQPDQIEPHRLDIWFHGRGETLSENNFLDQRLKQTGYYAPQNAIVLHPYGRYSNAFKFAGEVDVLEALDAVKRHYPIDEDRISVRGFSMGGAACWQFAVHYAGDWFAANPGAGFAETPEFLRFFQKEELHPTWWEKKLWHLYDCTDWCRNLAECPTIAYSGENDIQKQAADIMARALKPERMELTHIIGPKMGHRIDPASVQEIESRMADLARIGRRRVPESIKFVTYTLKYNRLKWLKVTGIKEHWEPSSVQASIQSPSHINVNTKNVTGVELEFGPGEWPRAVGQVTLAIDGQTLFGAKPKTDRSLKVSLVRGDGGWEFGTFPEDQLRKRHDLQGPIDDALMDSFVFVKPTGTAANSQVGTWVDAELIRAVEHWRRHFRGRAAREERHGHHAGGHPKRQPDSVGRSREQPGAEENRGQAAHRLERGLHHRRRSPILREGSRADCDLSQPAQSQAVRGAQQQLYVPGIRVSQQRPPGADAARLGRGRSENAPRHGLAGQDRRGGLL